MPLFGQVALSLLVGILIDCGSFAFKHVTCLNYLLYSRWIHRYGSPDLPLGRLLCRIRGYLGPLARIAEGDSGAPMARPPLKTIAAFSRSSFLFSSSGVFPLDRVTGRE